MPSRLFDAYIAVDWSAGIEPSPERPSRDAIWVGERVSGGSATEMYCRTRLACRELLEERIAEHVREGRRVFVGFDFPYGYPQVLARSLRLPGDQPWKALWQELQRLIVDISDNRNNRFDVAADLNSRCGPTEPGPFWGCPPGQQRPVLEATSPSVGFPYPVADGQALSRLRWTEKGLSGAQEVWKLWGAGSVGGQALVGIPVVAHIRFGAELQAVSQVWPFETGFTPRPTPNEGPFIVHAEIWPGLVSQRQDRNIIKDQAQVRDVTAWLSELDEAGTLGQYFDRPAELPEEGIVAALTEEGWIIGHHTYASPLV